MHFVSLPVISVMTGSGGKTLNTDSKEEGSDEERGHGEAGWLEVAAGAQLRRLLVLQKVCINWRTDTRALKRSGTSGEPSQHRDIGGRGRAWSVRSAGAQSVVTRYHRCYSCKCQQSDDAETNLWAFVLFIIVRLMNCVNKDYNQLLDNV